jgi:MoaA/NifB/PqqE/SkfB family radical SAM enzyme
MSVVSRLTEQDLTEAATVTGRGEGHQYEIQLGHLCNDRCVFCSSGQLTQLKRARSIGLDPMIAAIESARAGGARRITFLGGEPTLHKGLPTALKRAVDLGFEEIVIFTNGVMLPHPGFVDRIVTLGRFEWRISIQGATEEAHVAVTGRKDSFRRIIDGLRLLKARGQHVTANICVNDRSYRSLPEFPPLVREHGVRQLHIDIVRPSSTGQRTEEYLRDIMPRYSVMAPYIGQMLARFEKELPDFDVNIGNLPFCILPEWAHRISHGGEQTYTQSCGEAELEIAVDKYNWHASMRRHVAACDGCAFRRQCTGIFSTYLDMYGEEEFKAVPLAAVQSSPRAAHHFVLLAEPYLAPVEAAAAREPAPGWRLAEVVRDHRGAAVDMHFRGPADAHVALKFGPPAAGGASILTDRYALRIEAEDALAEADLRALLEWSEAILRRDASVRIIRPLDLAAELDGHRRVRLVSQGRQKIAELVARAEELVQFGAWRAAGHRSEGDDVIVDLAGPGGLRIGVVFAVRDHAGTPRIALDARPGPGVDVTVTRSVVAAFAGALRSTARAGQTVPGT